MRLARDMRPATIVSTTQSYKHLHLITLLKCLALINNLLTYGNNLINRLFLIYLNALNMFNIFESNCPCILEGKAKQRLADAAYYFLLYFFKKVF